MERPDEEISIERVAQAVVNCISSTSDRLWEAGDVLAALPDGRRGKPTLTVLAPLVGKSVVWLSKLRTTSRAFPEGSRALDHPWRVHYLCATTQRPEYWLARAVKEDLNGRGLIELLIREGEKQPPVRHKARMYPPEVQAVIQAAREVVRYGPEMIVRLDESLRGLP